jgi:predicted RNA binding protein YcfA (HicA-like mRNA interferase family)
MARLPVISGADAVRAFERVGWRQDRQKGSHVVLLKEGQTASLSVPQHRTVAGYAAVADPGRGAMGEEFCSLL